MKSLLPLERPPLAYYNKIIANKEGRRHEILGRLREKIRKRYQQYRASAPDLQTLHRAKDLTREQRKALHHCYNVSRKAVESLRTKILERCNSCPYCGLNEPDTLDHYLPKELEQFPEYSVCTYNLIPCCTPCNRDYKHTAWLTDGQRTYLHFYFDDIKVDVEFLKAHISLGSSTNIRYSIEQSSWGSESFYRLYKRHFDGLDLGNRFADRARDKLGIELDSIRRHIYGSNPSEVSDRIRWKFEIIRRRFGANHWQTAMWRALYEPRVVDWCLSRPPSDGGTV